ncbi:amidohydrolase family protein [Sphingomonas qomolangmaensis]|uniref:Amidohydrolase family protein n=1 Tax=Sphingomonas qomolangmaensis TaxID=2918765 RepID=A0ABY5LC95_9SPHN|nr:amidohydrolase family protein [Sphingomonas qomolangmaensis]UUL82306.1 amidohydrolase family protein [Sphingomonas qomolangmaensis]
MRIIDAHCHIASLDHIPRSFVEGAVGNIHAHLEAQGIRTTKEKLTTVYLAKLEDPLCDALVAEMDAAGIEKSVLLAADFTHQLRDSRLTIAETYAAHRVVLARHPGRFVVFGGMDPRWGKDGVDLFEQSLREFGFRGFKLYPPTGFSPSDPSLYPFYEICRDYRVPVTVHIGPTSPALSFKHAYPFLLDEAAQAFPEVNFIMAHGAVSFVEECAMLCAFRPNVYMDISAFQSAMRRDGNAGAVRSAALRGINHKIIFGTDWPVFRLQGDQPSFVDAVAGDEGALAQLSVNDQRLILHGNIERLLAQARVPAAAAN